MTAEPWHDPDAPLCQRCGHVEEQPHCQLMCCGCVGFYGTTADMDYQAYWDGLSETDRAEELRMLDNHEGSGA